MWDNSRRSGEAQELLNRKVGKLYDSYSSSIVQLSYFFAKEVLNSSSLALWHLIGPLSCCRIRMPHIMSSD